MQVGDLGPSVLQPGPGLLELVVALGQIVPGGVRGDGGLAVGLLGTVEPVLQPGDTRRRKASRPAPADVMIPTGRGDPVVTGR